MPKDAARGGVKTLYPEYRSVVAGTTTAAALTVPQSKSAIDYKKRIADQSPRDGQVHVMPVQGNVYMLIADGTNITASVGADGVLVVNTGTAAIAPKLLDALKQLSSAVSSRAMPKECFGANCPGAWGWSSPFIDAVIASPAPPKPIRYIFNTSAAPEDVGGNQTIAAAGFFPRVSRRLRRGGRQRRARRVDRRARERARTAMSARQGAEPRRSRRTRSSTSSTSCRNSSTVKRS